MAQSFKETAHLRTDLKKLHENWDSIDWGKTYKEEVAVKQPSIKEIIKQEPLLSKKHNHETFAALATGSDMEQIEGIIRKLREEVSTYKAQLEEAKSIIGMIPSFEKWTLVNFIGQPTPMKEISFYKQAIEFQNKYKD